MTDTPINKTLVTGQLLQIRDKLMAKRHLIPTSFQAEWKNLAEQTAVFDAAEPIHFKSGDLNEAKQSKFKGSVNDLVNLVEAMRNLDRQIKIAVH